MQITTDEKYVKNNDIKNKNCYPFPRKIFEILIKKTVWRKTEKLKKVIFPKTLALTNVLFSTTNFMSKLLIHFKAEKNGDLFIKVNLLKFFYIEWLREF